MAAKKRTASTKKKRPLADEPLVAFRLPQDLLEG